MTLFRFKNKIKKERNKEKNISKIYSHSGKFAERAKLRRVKHSPFGNFCRAG